MQITDCHHVKAPQMYCMSNFLSLGFILYVAPAIIKDVYNAGLETVSIFLLLNRDVLLAPSGSRLFVCTVSVGILYSHCFAF